MDRDDEARLDLDLSLLLTCFCVFNAVGLEGVRQFLFAQQFIRDTTSLVQEGD